MMLPRVFQLASGQSVECAECGSNTSIIGLMKVGKSITAVPDGNTDGESTWEPHHDDWLCPDCQDGIKDDLADQPLVTVPEPPDEWRFCQRCGEQISPTQLQGQYCTTCSDE